VAESVVLLRRKTVRDRRYPVVNKGRSHFHKLIAKLPDGPYYTVSQVEFLVERDLKTIKRWIRSGKIEPPSKHIRVYGELVYLYTPEDVERFRAFADSR